MFPLEIVRRLCPAGLVIVTLWAAGGCAAYVTPGRAADFAALGITPAEQAALTEDSISQRLNRKPAASFPAILAVARLQGTGYRSYSYDYSGANAGNAVLVTLREHEAEPDMFEQLGRQPQVRAVAPMNRMMSPEQVRGERDLREAAASLQADMLLMYTFDTQFLAQNNVPLVGLISLGVLPDRARRVRSTCSAALVDTRTGFVYAVAEGTAQRSQISNAWGSSEAAESARLAAENDALVQVADQMISAWGRIASQYGPKSALEASFSDR